jgi:hypothetical protein
VSTSLSTAKRELKQPPMVLTSLSASKRELTQHLMLPTSTAKRELNPTNLSKTKMPTPPASNHSEKHGISAATTFLVNTRLRMRAPAMYLSHNGLRI